MRKKSLGKRSAALEKKTKNVPSQGRTYARPKWVPQNVSSEEELCPECFKVVGVQSRYKLVLLLGKEEGGMSVSALTDQVRLRQPTITHHLNILKSVGAVTSAPRGREHIYRLNRNAHCFEECNIPY